MDGDLPVSVNIQGESAPIAAWISYRQITNFQTLPSTSSVTGYSLEFRDASDNVLFTYNFNNATFRNTTLVLTGSEDPAANAAIGIISIPNY